MMPNKLQCEQSKEDEMEQHEREKLTNLIRKQVINALGTPIDLQRVQVHKVWNHHYRVNVFVGVNAASVRVANSYFLVIDNDGSLIATTPKIVRQY
jgi:hypothetical protein